MKMRLVVIASVLLLPPWACAGNLDFLNDTPLYYFQDSDRDMMLNNADTALNHGKDLQKFSWKNSTTGAWGYAVASHTHKVNGLECRDLLMFNSARTVTGKATYKFCKIKSEWKYAD